MTAPRGKARNRFFRASDGPRWNKREELDRQVVNRTASAMSAFGQDAEERLEAKPASAAAKPGRPMTIAQLARDSAE